MHSWFTIDLMQYVNFTDLKSILYVKSQGQTYYSM